MFLEVLFPFHYPHRTLSYYNNIIIERILLNTLIIIPSKEGYKLTFLKISCDHTVQTFFLIFLLKSSLTLLI